jgi:hypothetical protein
MNVIEPLLQISDAVSFFLVTPEFLGEERLAYFRRQMLDWVRFLVHKYGWLNSELIKPNVSLPLLWFASTIANLIIFGVIFLLLGSPIRSLNTDFVVGLSFVFVAIAIFTMAGWVLTTILWVLMSAQEVAFRSTLFAVGVILFVGTRIGAVIFYALHEAASIPTLHNS